MVGLPARGKSYISKRLKRSQHHGDVHFQHLKYFKNRWLNWTGLPTEVFNVGNYRRQKTTDASSQFFDSSDKAKEQLRHQLAVSIKSCQRRVNTFQNQKTKMAVLEECIEYLNKDGTVAIHDATNTTEDRYLS